MLSCKNVNCYKCNNVYLSFVMTCIRARTDSPSLVMVAPKRVFSRRNVLKNRSDVIVDVHKILTNYFGRSWISFFVLRSFTFNGRIYTRDELSDAEFILEDDLPISDDLASRNR